MLCQDGLSRMSMKLAYIIGTYPELTTTFIDREVRILREIGFRIQTLSIRHTNSSVLLDEEYTKIEKQTIYLIPINWGKFVSAQLHFILESPISFFKTFFFLFSRPHPNMRFRVKTLLHFFEGVFAAYCLKDLGIEHIHAHFIDRAATVALCTSRLLNLSYSLTAHADDIFKDPVLISEKISESKFTVTVSEYNKKYLLKHYPNLEAAKLKVLHPWVDVSRFTPPESRVSGSRLRIISVARLVENKGHQYLIEACHQLLANGLDFQCNIIGEGPWLGELETLIRKRNLGDYVNLLGGQPQSEVMRQLQESDVFVLAAIVAKDGMRDGMPVAIAEAMAMELPVISTDIVGISEMVKGSAGLLVPPNDSNNLAKAIKQIWDEDPSTRYKMGKTGRRIISEEFNLYKGTTQLAELFQHDSSGN